MKNNVIKILPLALTAALMVTGCRNNKKPDPTPEPPAPIWSEEIDEAMVLYCGEVLPFAELNKETLTYGYNDSTAIFYVYDDNEVKLLENYAELLVSAGFEETENEDILGDTYISYDKTNEVGDISVTFGFDEGDDETLPGNFINVAVPEYVTEDLLAEWGYEKQQGWPAQLVADTLEGSGITVPAVNEDGEWWTASELSHDDEYGDWYCAYLATKGDFVEEMDAALLSSGCAFDDYFGGYGDAAGVSDFFITVAKVRDFTIVNVEGPTLAPTVASEEEQADGSIDVKFTFADALENQTPYDGFESTSASVAFDKGGNNNAPTFYSNNNTLRFYAKNTITVTAAEGLTINNVVIEVGSLKTLTPASISVSSGTVSASATSAPSTVTISGVNASTLTITVGPNATGGNIGMSSIKVNVSSVE